MSTGKRKVRMENIAREEAVVGERETSLNAKTWAG